jgi:hypothetical protein
VLVALIHQIKMAYQVVLAVAVRVTPLRVLAVLALLDKEILVEMVALLQAY